MTPAKRMMTDQHKSPSDEIRAFILEYFVGDLVTKDMLKSAVIMAASKLDYPQFMSAPGSITRILWGRLGPLRDAPHGARYSVEGEQVEVRAIRNKKKWIAVDSARETETILNELALNQPSGAG